MTNYPIPTGPDLPTFRNITVESDLAANGWRVNGQLQHTDGRVRYFAAIVETLDVLQNPKLWADWLEQARIDHEHLKGKTP